MYEFPIIFFLHTMYPTEHVGRAKLKLSLSHADNLIQDLWIEHTFFFSWKYTKAALINSKNIHSYFKTTSNTRATVLHNSRKNID